MAADFREIAARTYRELIDGWRQEKDRLERSLFGNREEDAAASTHEAIVDCEDHIAELEALSARISATG